MTQPDTVELELDSEVEINSDDVPNTPLQHQHTTMVDESSPKTEPSEDEISTCDVEKDSPQSIMSPTRTRLNVGGVWYDVATNVLAQIGVASNVEFLDRDPFYFKRAVAYINDKHLSDDSPQLLLELELYGLISSSDAKPKIQCEKRNIEFQNDASEIITLQVGAKAVNFATKLSTLSRSRVLHNMVSQSRVIKLPDLDAKIFRYVLNLMRTRLLCVVNRQILSMLNRLQIAYHDLTNQKPLGTNIAIHYDKTIQTSAFLSYQSMAFCELSTLLESYPLAKAQKGVAFNYDISAQQAPILGEMLEFQIKGPDVYHVLEGVTLVLDMPVMHNGQNLDYDRFAYYRLLETIQLKLLSDNAMQQLLHCETYGCERLWFDVQHDVCLQQIRHMRVSLWYQNQFIDIYRLRYRLNIAARDMPLPVSRICEKAKLWLTIGLAKHDVLLSHIGKIPVLNAVLKCQSRLTQPVNNQIYTWHRRHLLRYKLSKGDFSTIKVPLSEYKTVQSFQIAIQSQHGTDKFLDVLIDVELGIMQNSEWKACQRWEKQDLMVTNVTVPIYACSFSEDCFGLHTAKTDLALAINTNTRNCVKQQPPAQLEIILDEIVFHKF